MLSLPIIDPLDVATRPGWHRLAFLELDDHVLLMDRGNGKWAMVPQSEAPVARLLLEDGRRLPAEIIDRRAHLEALLTKHGLGTSLADQADDLTTIIIKLTNACNFACEYCYDYEAFEKATRLSTSKAIAAIEQALTLAPRALTVILHGGEPLLVFPAIKEIVTTTESMARTMGKTLVFVGQTNLSRLTNEVVEFSEAHSINWGISFDGPPQINDALRVTHTGTSTSDYLVAALRAFPAFVRKCNVMTTITSATEDCLLEIADYYKRLGMRGWDWSLFQPIGRGRSVSSKLEFSTERVINSWNTLFDRVEAGDFNGFSVMPILHYVNNFILGPGRNMCMRKHCGAGRDLLSISSNGTIEACDCIDPQGPLAGLGVLDPENPHSLENARSSNTATLIRSRDVETGKCGECIWLSVCGGTCLAHADAINGIWHSQCAIALNAFDRIARSLEKTDALRAYRTSCC